MRPGSGITLIYSSPNIVKSNMEGKRWNRGTVVVEKPRPVTLNINFQLRFSFSRHLLCVCVRKRALSYITVKFKFLFEAVPSRNEVS